MENKIYKGYVNPIQAKRANDGYDGQTIQVNVYGPLHEEGCPTYDTLVTLVVGDQKIYTEEEHSAALKVVLTECTNIINVMTKKLQQMNPGMDLDFGALDTIAQNPRFAEKAREIAQNQLNKKNEALS